MILPIYSYGHPILREKCTEVSYDTEWLLPLIENMWQTMYNANGCGLAAPQVGKAVRLFIVDSKTTHDSLSPEERKYSFANGDTGIRETFINATVVSSSGEYWEEEEGCLSILNMTRLVQRPVKIAIEYRDRENHPHSRDFSGTTARMIQHEYDHTNGVLYLDYLKPLARKILQGKLKKISTGRFPAKYPMIYLNEMLE